MNLDHLLDPVNLTTFFDEYWESKYLHIPRAAPNHYGDLLTIHALDTALCSNALRTGDCRFARESQILMGDAAAFSNSNTLSGILDSRKVQQLFSDGWTIIFERAHRWHASMNQLCAELFEVLNHHAQCNVYLSPPGSYGFGPHFDTHDVLVLQIHGRKKWRLYSDFITLPLVDQAKPLPSPPDEKRRVELILEQGDALYIPRGLVHDADSLDDASAHITLGILSYTWSDLFANLMKRVATRNVEFRRALPPKFLGDKGLPGLKHKILQLADVFTSEIRDSQVLEQYGESDFSDRGVIRHPIGLLSNSVFSHAISLTSVLAIQQGCCPFKVQVVDKKTLAIKSCKKRVLFPVRIRETIDFLLGRRKVVVGEIPGLDDSSKVVLGQRLVQEGVMSVQRL